MPPGPSAAIVAGEKNTATGEIEYVSFRFYKEKNIVVIFKRMLWRDPVDGIAISCDG